MRARLNLLLPLRALPREVARFWWRAYRTAQRAGDTWALEAATRPRDLAAILDVARERATVVELGTGPGWTTIALALDDGRRRVVSHDPVNHSTPYRALVDDDVLERIEFRQAPGADGPARGRADVDLLFIDSTHEREPTLAEFAAWLPAMAPDGVVAFHDYGHPQFPGVAEAVAELGLEGEEVGGMFIWRAPS